MISFLFKFNHSFSGIMKPKDFEMKFKRMRMFQGLG